MIYLDAVDGRVVCEAIEAVTGTDVLLSYPLAGVPPPELLYMQHVAGEWQWSGYVDDEAHSMRLPAVPRGTGVLPVVMARLTVRYGVKRVYVQTTAYHLGELLVWPSGQVYEAMCARMSPGLMYQAVDLVARVTWMPEVVEPHVMVEYKHG